MKIYEVVGENVILFGCEIWYNNTEKLRNKLPQIQRLTLKQLTKVVYKTVSLDAMQIMAGCPPIDIIVKAELTKFKLIRKSQEIEVNGGKLKFKDLELGMELIEPWDMISIPWDVKSDDGLGYRIYKDGSKCLGKVGC
ncbi:hypothetical protein AVEN_117799-1 [Araneus ventricosus]|uniref:Uncharacterized protein n=1 Tax=Araneus ventricosus TaxID=182803 RepID=A0A4Y2BAB7_ARAVE|nr:hypothetical protein AVEN_117799-1 [Araneus ventricosus]